MLRDGCWKGQSAVIIGGGPSLRDFDWSLLAGARHCIAVNRAIIDLPAAEIFFTEDLRVIDKYAPQLNAMRGTPVYHALDPNYVQIARNHVPRMHVLESKRPDKFWSHSLADGMSYSSNSAVGACNLAEILGAYRVYLLGIDCAGANGRFASNYHEDYPDDWRVNAAQLQDFASDWKHWVAPNVACDVINVINPAAPSVLDCFSRMTFDAFYREMGLTASEKAAITRP